MRSPEFRATLHHLEDFDLLLVRGDVCEDSVLPSTELVRAPILILDTFAVQRVNSTGVRLLWDWLASVHGGGRRVILSRCSVAVVSVLNLFSRFTRDVEVDSVTLAYLCPDCGTEQLGVHRVAGLGTPKPLRCVDCSSFAVVDAEDLRFLTRTRVPELDEEMRRAIERVVAVEAS